MSLRIRRIPREGPFPAPPLLTLAYLIVALGAGHALAVPYLVVTTDAGRELAAIPLDERPHWHLAWNHSVTGVHVRDYYAYEDGILMLTDTHTPAYDAGLGHLPGRGRAESDGAGGYWIRDIDEPVPGNAYWLRVGSPRVAHTIVHGDTRWDLSALAAGERVRIGVEERTGVEER